MKKLEARIKKKTGELNSMAQQIAQSERQLRELKVKALRKDGEITALKELEAEREQKKKK